MAGGDEVGLEAFGEVAVVAGVGVDALRVLGGGVGGDRGEHLGPMPGQVHHFIALENEQDRAYGLKRFMAETRRLYGVLDRRLDGRDFVAGDLSIADFAILGWAWRHPRHKVDLADFPNVKRWYEALMARPAVKRGMEAKLD